MKFSANVRALTIVGCAALIPSVSAPAQVSVQFHFGEDDYHRIDSRHPLRGRQYQTMGTLAHMLDEGAQDLKREAYRDGRRSTAQARLLASVSEFARRASDFHQRMDGYLDAPWEMGREVDDLAKRARVVNQSFVSAHLFPTTYDLWAGEIDILGRMQQVLRGADVQLPTPVRRGGESRDARGGEWEHRDADRNGNGVPDRLEAPAPPPDRPFDRERGDSRAANVPELRRFGKELDERVTGMRASMPRGDRDSRVTEDFDRFSADARRLRQTLDGDRFDAREVKESVGRLLDTARRSSNQSPRDQAWSGNRNDWQRILEILSRMQGLL